MRLPADTTPNADATEDGCADEFADGLDDASGLRHLLVVGGSIEAWFELGDAAWSQRMRSFADFGDAVGASWVTLRPYGTSSASQHLATSDSSRRSELTRHFEGAACQVIVDPTVDGREKFVAAMRSIAATDPVDEATVAAALYHPADSEPDLVVILGSPTALPPSLVWELAYAELFYVDAVWADLDTEVLAAAVTDFSSRSRRFGGLDE